VRGDFVDVWPRIAPDIWSKLRPIADQSRDAYPELYRELESWLTTRVDPPVLADRSSSPERARAAIAATKAHELPSELAAVSFLEAAHGVLSDLDQGRPLATRYLELLGTFIRRYGLRYELRPPCRISPSLAGIFARMMLDLEGATQGDAHLAVLMDDFQHALADLRGGCTDVRIKTCIQKQMNLLEALGASHSGVNQTTLGAISDQIGTWPHTKVKDALKSLYGFACDYPGIRHGGRASSALRRIDMRDLVAMSVLIAGFTPYLTDLVSPQAIYDGGP
jgi:hypothetical protein